MMAEEIGWSTDGIQIRLDPEFLTKVNSNWHRSRSIWLPSLRVEADVELRKLCVRATVQAYINATRVARQQSNTRQLFLCYRSDLRKEPVSKQRISTWLKEVIKDAYAIKGLELPSNPKGHDVRKVATSWADMARVEPQLICEAATWSSSCTFARHYNLKLIRSNKLQLSKSVLRSSASTSAERRQAPRAATRHPYGCPF